MIADPVIYRGRERDGGEGKVPWVPRHGRGGSGYINAIPPPPLASPTVLTARDHLFRQIKTAEKNRDVVSRPPE